MTQYKRNKLVEVSGKLAKVAMGSAFADVVIKNGTLVNVYSGELIAQMDVAVADGRVAFVGQADHTIGDQTVVIDAAAGAIRKRPGSAITSTCSGNLASAARIGAQNASISISVA